MKARWIVSAVPLVTLCIAVWLVHRELQDYSLPQLIDLVFGFPPGVLLAASGLTLIGYLVLAAYDGIALHHVKRDLPWWQVLLAGFSSFAVSNTVGHALVSGGSLRYRFYSGWGVGSLEIAQIILLSTVTYFLANGTLLAASYLLTPSEYFDDRHLAGGYLHLVMWAVIAMLLGYWALVLGGKRALSWREHTMTLPGVKITVLQSLVGAADLLLAAAVLYVLLRQHMGISFGIFLNAYLLAQVVGLFSQSPGGIGVFEGVFLYLLTGSNPSAHVLAALLVYRLIYFFLPLLIAGVLILLYELWEREALRERVIAPWLAIRPLLPVVFSLLMLAGGAMLLVSGAIPAQDDRLDWLGGILPVGLIEASHLVASMTGLLLVVLARAVRLKLRAAYFAAMALLAVGIAASLLKGADFEEAAVLSVLLLLLLPAKAAFYRPSRLDRVGLTRQWALVVAGILGVAMWLGLYAYREVEYSHELWWTVDLHGDAQRFLRSTLVLVIAALVVLVFFFLRRSRYVPHLPDAVEMQLATALVRQSPYSNHFLALTGDKCFFWNERRSAFITYVTTRRYWIAIDDPCGSPELLDDLLWQFREAADRFGARLVFYRVRPELLPLYLDLGLSLVKLGEEAVTDLAGFGLSGKQRAPLRYIHNKLQKEGCEFRVLARDEIAAVLDELEAVSNDWLQAKNTREKGISLGFFDRDYLLRSDVAVVTRAARIVAFANLWRPDIRRELSIDLMRYASDAPRGAMEYLTICLMLWAQEQGYQGFNLGMAPLSGLEQRTLAPLWHKVGNSVFRYGNEFYNFQGLRAYKDKFDPQWSPRYLAVPSTLDVPAVLLQVSTLIAGGLRGIFGK